MPFRQTESIEARVSARKCTDDCENSMDISQMISNVCMRLKGAVLLRHSFIVPLMEFRALVVRLRVLSHEIDGVGNNFLVMYNKLYFFKIMGH